MQFFLFITVLYGTVWVVHVKSNQRKSPSKRPSFENMKQWPTLQHMSIISEEPRKNHPPIRLMRPLPQHSKPRLVIVMSSIHTANSDPELAQGSDAFMALPLSLNLSIAFTVQPDNVHSFVHSLSISVKIPINAEMCVSGVDIKANDHRAASSVQARQRLTMGQTDPVDKSSLLDPPLLTD